jgi:LAS superfamily LD-carboxypeptidase LdcB
MSLFKEPFDASIIGQLNKRQELIGDINRTPQNIAYLNGKTAWIQLRSSVDVNGSFDLAASNVLLGGILLPGNKLRTGEIGNKGFGVYDAATYNKTTDTAVANIFGLRPMPGITDISIQSKSAYGSLRQATVNFQCWDPKQLDILETLYMRPGYTVLLEWGWTPYIDNNGKLISQINHDENFFAHKNIDVQQYLTNLRGRALGSYGNYDSMFGYIKNYSWKLRPDLGYDCMTEIISTGEILESFKINYSGASTAASSTGTLLSNIEYDKIEDIQKDYRKNLLGGLLAETYALAKSTAGTRVNPVIALSAASPIVGASVAAAALINPDILTSINEGSNTITYTANNGKTGTIDYATKELELEKDDWTATDSSANDGKEATEGYVTDDDSNVYITLRSFIELLNNFILIENPNSSNTDKHVVKLSVDNKPESINAGQPLRCLYNPLQISVDPRVCILKNPSFEKLIQGINIVDETPANPPVIQTISPKDTAAQFDPIINQLKDIREKDGIGSGLMQDFKNVLAKIKTKEELAGLSDYYYTKYNQDFYEFLTEDNLSSSSLTGAYVTLPSSVSVFEVFSGLGIKQEDVLYFENDFVRNLAKAVENTPGVKSFKAADVIQAFISVTPEERQKRAAVSGQNKTEEQKETLSEIKEDINSSEVGYLSLCNQLTQAYNPGDGSSYGIHSNIFLNLRMLYNLASSPELEGQDPAEKQSINLLSYLKDVLTMVQNSIGNVNNFEIVIDGNVGYIVDVNNVPTTSVTPFTFEVGSEKSIVRDISLESQIFSDQSTIIAVAAQSDAGKLGLENSSMVAYNNGITDRNIEKKDSPINSNISGTDSLTGFVTALADLAELFDSMDKMLGIFDSELLVDSIEKYKKSLTDIIVFFTSYYKTDNKYKAILPTKLSITTDGISGLIIGNIFDIDKALTPKSYKGTFGYGVQLQYLITNIKQDVRSNNQWTTTIEGNPFIPDSTFDSLTSGQPPVSTEGITIRKSRVYNKSTGKEEEQINITPPPKLSSKVGAEQYPCPPDWVKKYSNGNIPQSAMVGISQTGPAKYEYKGTKGWHLLHPTAAAQFVKLKAAADKAGHSIIVSSAYRDNANQTALVNAALEKQRKAGVKNPKRPSTIAAPGSSAHGFGGAIDIRPLYRLVNGSGNAKVNAAARAKSPLYAWLAANGPAYGWYNPYRLADGNRTDEIWHWEYWGHWFPPKL